MPEPIRQHAGRRRRLEPTIVAALIPALAPVGPAEARPRREATREVEKQIGRALWRAERRARGLPRHVRRSASYVMGARRKLSYELVRALLALGAGPELANAIAERAAARFPRDGVVIEGPARRLREHGAAPRQVGKAPRDKGTNPRARGSSPRQRLAAADLSETKLADVVRGEEPPEAPPAPPATPAKRPTPPPPDRGDAAAAWPPELLEQIRAGKAELRRERLERARGDDATA